MAKAWTAAQQAAISTRNKTLLISAGAGSGKTATLTERIIQRICDENDGADISKMLVVTFSRAAAAELKNRIFSALNDALAQNPSNKHIASQLLKLGSAKISTIDSFCFDLLKENSATVGLPSNIRIADDAEYILLAESILNRVIDDAYEAKSSFPSFVECFATINQLKQLAEIFLDIHDSLCSLPEGIEFLRLCAERAEREAELDFFSTSYGNILKESSSQIFSHYLTILQDACEFAKQDEKVFAAYGEQFLYDREICRSLCDAINADNGYSLVRAIISAYTPADLNKLSSKSSCAQSVMYKELRNEFKNTLKKLGTSSFAKPADMIKRAMLDTSEHIHTLYELLHDFEVRIGEEKSKLGIMTFNDIRRLTLSLLVSADGAPTALAQRYSEEFCEIYLDEYQDVDRVQDLIFSSIAKPNNRFMVGDIKQCIYAFRGSEPKLFAAYREKFPIYNSKEALNSCSASVFMSDNFRCDENIIKFTNLVCSTVFTASDSLGYTPNDDLKFAKSVPSGDYVSPKVAVKIITPYKSDDATKITKKAVEAEYIASEIERLLREGKKADGSKIVPSDIAVLYRGGEIATDIADALKRRGIRSTDKDATKYFESPDILMLLCILNAVDNPERDTYLAGALRSPIFDFTLDDLIKIRTSSDESMSLFAALQAYSTEQSDALSEHCRDFLCTLTKWQEAAISMPIDKFLQYLFDDSRFVATGLLAHTREDGSGGNLMLLYEFSRGFERSGFKGLYQFIEFINSMIEKRKTFSLTDPSAMSKNMVTITTMHKSKGLEFPVCFIAEAAQPIRSKDINNSLVYDYPCGVAMKISDDSGFARINTPMRSAIISQIELNQAEEEMRILYVALTRARERLYISAVSSKGEDKLFAPMPYIDRYSVINRCASYLDWILLTCKSPVGESYEFEFINSASISFTPTASTELAQEKSSVVENTELTQMLRDKFNFEYPYLSLSRIPSKLSVSRLYPDVLDENNDSLELFTKERKARVPSILSGIVDTRASSAERGTATHLFLQFCDFSRLQRFGVDEELIRLEHLKFLPTSIGELIYKDELERFAHSELIEKIIAAKQVIREQRFNVELPVHGFTHNEGLLSQMSNESLAVQGVIDLILINDEGEIELYDYKTDRLTLAELTDISKANAKMNAAHATQLSYYAKAVELLFGRPCKHIAVYSTHSAKLYEITTQNTAAQNLFDV